MRPDDPLLVNLRQRPALYLGETSLALLEAFLNGFAWALDVHNVGDPRDRDSVPREFNDWVAYRLHFYESTSGWRRMINSQTPSEAAAMERFFTLLDEFHARRPRTVARLVNYRKTWSRVVQRREGDRYVTERTETLQYPSSIALVTYTDDPGFFVYSETDEELPHPGYYPSLESFELRTDASRDLLTIVDPEWRPGKASL